MLSGKATYASGSGHATYLVVAAVVIRGGMPQIIDEFPILRAGLFPIEHAKILNTWPGCPLPPRLQAPEPGLKSTIPPRGADPQNRTIHHIREGRSAHIHDNVGERASPTGHKVLDRLVDYSECSAQQERKQRASP